MISTQDEIDLCVSALMGLKVARQAYASGVPYQSIRTALADALAMNDTPMCKGVADAIRGGFLENPDILGSKDILK